MSQSAGALSAGPHTNGGAVCSGLLAEHLPGGKARGVSGLCRVVVFILLSLTFLRERPRSGRREHRSCWGLCTKLVSPQGGCLDGAETVLLAQGRAERPPGGQMRGGLTGAAWGVQAREPQCLR